MTDKYVIDNKIYKEWHSYYINSSDEHDQAIKFITPTITNLKKSSSLLDIGSGNGALTKRVSQHFSKTTVIEPNDEYNKIFEENNFDFTNEYFLNCQLKESFDFILCSHVFWLVKKSDQEAFINKMFSLLNPGGCISIITPASYGQGFDFFTSFFLDMNCDCNKLSSKILKAGYNIEIIPFTSHIRSNNFETFFSICKLFTLESWLHPINLSSKEIAAKIGNVKTYTNQKLKEIENYIKQNLFLKTKKEYSLEECEVIINIKKK